MSEIPPNPGEAVDPLPGVTATPGEPPPPPVTGRPQAGSGLRVRTARGTIINTAFLVGVNTLNLVRGFLVAAFLTTSDYGVWGVILVVLYTLCLLYTSPSPRDS